MNRSGKQLAAPLLVVALLLAGPASGLHADCLPAGAPGSPCEECATAASRRQPPLEKIILELSAPSAAALTGRAPDGRFVAAELDRIAGRIRPDVAGVSDPARLAAAFNRVVFGQERFVYDAEAGNPGNYLLDEVLVSKRANCLGFTVLYLALAERLRLPMRGVYVPSHCFARIESPGGKVNLEFAERGACWDDGRYERLFRLAPGRPYLRSLDRDEMIGVYLKSLGAACARRDMTAEARRLYGEAARRYPGMPDVHYNEAVLAMREGREDEAIASYRRTLALDPGHAQASNNLAAALARKGLLAEARREARKAVELDPADDVARANLGQVYLASGMSAEGIREFDRILDADGANPRALAGLVKGYFIRGEYGRALAYCDRADRLGCRIDPVLRERVEMHRHGAPGPSP